MPIWRDGRGLASLCSATRADRVSTGTAISGTSVTPMPALTICTSVESDDPSIMSRGADRGGAQKASA